MNRNIFLYTRETNPVIDKFYGDFDYRRFKSNGLLVYPFEAIRHKIIGQIDPDFTIFEPKGRAKIHKELQRITASELEILRQGTYKSKSVQYEDNRVSKYVAQQGKCFITKTRLLPTEAICHHKIPTAKGGSDEYDNLVIIHKDVHWLIHNNNLTKVRGGIKDWTLGSVKRLDVLRVLAGYSKVT